MPHEQDNHTPPSDPLLELIDVVGEHHAAPIGEEALRQAPHVAAETLRAREPLAWLTASLAEVDSGLMRRGSARGVIDEWFNPFRGVAAAKEAAFAQLQGRRFDPLAFYGPLLDHGDKAQLELWTEKAKASVWIRAKSRLRSERSEQWRSPELTPFEDLDERLTRWCWTNGELWARKVALGRQLMLQRELESIRAEVAGRETDDALAIEHAELVPIGAIRRASGPDLGYGDTTTDAGYWRQLRDDVARRGFESPLTLKYDPATGRGRLKDGDHRLAIAAELGMTHVPLVVHLEGLDARMWPLPGIYRPHREHPAPASGVKVARPSTVGLPTSKERFRPAPRGWQKRQRRRREAGERPGWWAAKFARLDERRFSAVETGGKAMLEFLARESPEVLRALEHRLIEREMSPDRFGVAEATSNYIKLKMVLELRQTWPEWMELTRNERTAWGKNLDARIVDTFGTSSPRGIFARAWSSRHHSETEKSLFFEGTHPGIFLNQNGFDAILHYACRSALDKYELEQELAAARDGGIAGHADGVEQPEVKRREAGNDPGFEL